MFGQLALGRVDLGVGIQAANALTQQRPYKAAWSVGEALAEIERQRGHQFDPTLADAFLRIIEPKAAKQA